MLLCRAGGIEEYCRAAAAALAPGGRFVVCCGLQGQPFRGQRVQRAAAAAGLAIVRQVTVVTREGKPPLFAVYVMQHHHEQQQPAAVGCVEEAFVVRRADEAHTPQWHAAREAMGLPPLAL
jgi:tRNA1(Val) A37 N6-methylase TrmN6